MSVKILTIYNHIFNNICVKKVICIFNKFVLSVLRKVI